MADFSDQVARLDPQVARWKDVEGTIVVMDLRNSAYFSVEGSITYAWESLVEGARLGDIVEKISTEFDADDAVVLSDVQALVEDLHRRGLLTLES